MEIADYDRPGYDYTKYWQKRQYEDRAERLALNTLLPQKGHLIIDLGGGFGRLSDLYSPRFNSCVLLDYSEKNLAQARVMMRSAGVSNLVTKQGDIYDVPFASNSFDVALMVRVIHHLKDPERAIKEVTRILNPGGIFILEFANKIHFKARIKSWLRRDFNFVKNLLPYEQPSNWQQGAKNIGQFFDPFDRFKANGLEVYGPGKREGKKSIKKGIFYNYHPGYISQMLTRAGFVVEKKISVSNFRSPFLKKFLPLRFLILLEVFVQSITCLSTTRFFFGPSIFLRCKKI